MNNDQGQQIKLNQDLVRSQINDRTPKDRDNKSDLNIMMSKSANITKREVGLKTPMDINLPVHQQITDMDG